MKGRKRVHDRPVARNFTIELWMDNLIEESRKFGIRPVDIIYNGLLATFKTDKKLPQQLIDSFLIQASPKAEELNDIIEFYTKEKQRLSTIPEEAQRKEMSEIPARTDKWFDSFHALKVLESTDTEKYILLLKSEYLKKPELFEIQDDNLDIDWNKLPKYYSIEAVQKVHSQNGSLKEDVPA